MANNKKNKKKHENIMQSVSALEANGLKAFTQRDLQKAITTWEKIPANLRPQAWLAQAHFRRGLALFYQSDTQNGLIHLQTARAYQPNDPCYAYHVGLALHRQGDMAGALSLYQAASKLPGPFAKRAAYPMALALLQTGQDATTSPGWKDLSPAQQAMLQSANFFRRRPYNLPAEAPLLWRALAALDGNDSSQARAGLDQALGAHLNPPEKAVAHYYQGVLAARAEDWDTARRAWNSAAAAGLSSPHLQANLAELYLRQAEDLLSGGNAHDALGAIEESGRLNPGDNAIKELSSQIHQQLGFDAAAENRWAEAQSHWQLAVERDSGSFRLAYNLALSYEKSDDYLLAGQTWREALRRRPRRADHPDALNDEQVARIWQRTAECYRKAGDFDEVGRTYQQAIKWAPENVEIRMALAETLLTEGRMQAARNELERVLERAPNNIPALLRMGEACFRDEDSYRFVKEEAKTYWNKVLQIDPKNSQAKQLLGEWYLDQGELEFSWNLPHRAIENYLKALEFNPKNVRTLIFLAQCHIKLGEREQGEEYASRSVALASNFRDFADIIQFWLGEKEEQRAWDVTALAEARDEKVPTNFYVAMAENLLNTRRKTQALPWLQRAVEKALPGEFVLVMIAEMALDIDQLLAKEYLLKALAAKQMPGHVNLLLGVVEYRLENKRAGNKYFSEAERIARQTGDDDLAHKIQFSRLVADGGPGALLQQLMKGDNKDLLEMFLNDFDEEFEDD